MIYRGSPYSDAGVIEGVCYFRNIDGRIAAFALQNQVLHCEAPFAFL